MRQQRLEEIFGGLISIADCFTVFSVLTGNIQLPSTVSDIVTSMYCHKGLSRPILFELNQSHVQFFKLQKNERKRGLITFEITKHRNIWKFSKTF